MEPLLHFREAPVKMARACLWDSCWTPPLGRIPVMSHRVKALGKTQEALEGQCLSAGLRRLGGSPSRTKMFSVEREVRTSLLRVTLPQIRKMDGWTDNKQ